MHTLPNIIKVYKISHLLCMMKNNFCHNISSNWNKYDILSIPKKKNITISITDGINSIEYVFLSSLREKNMRYFFIINCPKKQILCGTSIHSQFMIVKGFFEEKK